MSQQDSPSMTRAVQVQKSLVSKLIDHPDVSMIDVGYDPGSADKRICVRIHTRRRLDNSFFGLPVELDGIPVITMVADYREEI